MNTGANSSASQGGIDASQSDTRTSQPDLTEVVEVLREYIAQFDQMHEKIGELENSMKAFLDMQCMIGEESVNAFEIIINRLNGFDRAMSQSLKAGDTHSVVKTLTQLGDSPKYFLDALVDRKKFLSLQRYVSEEAVTGTGQLATPLLVLNLGYSSGNVFRIQGKAISDYTDLAAFAKQLDELQLKEWENESEEDLIALLAGQIQNTTQYLAGLTRVLHQLNKKQIIAKLQSRCIPLVQQKEDNCYEGEGLFHYALARWPEQGNQVFRYTVAQQEFSGTNTSEAITVNALLTKFDKCLRFVTPGK